ncbi:MAG: PIN domain nuclease, partial [Hydrococcus sp. RU_2_2]|nr:PIN domain nuclease [Hydrococcus sp. RU_2_2]
MLPRRVRERGELLCIVPQNVGEFWNVYTRPLEKNGLGHSASEAEAEVQHLENLFELRLDTAEIYQEWRRILIEYS